tara:strand:+ start:474 stop:932 length:459 start_codon:yes stop_codon:yes gene_type:complete
MKKLKELLKESFVWERKFGESLPTLKQIEEKYRQRLSEGKKHGFDLTDFKPNGFQKVLKALKIRPKAQLDRNESGWEWKGNGIIIVTGNNPLTGEYASAVSGKSPVKRKKEKNYASYMGIEGKPQLVAQAVELIKQQAAYIKGESKGQRNFI